MAVRAAHAVVLGRRELYMLPTRPGLLYSLLLVVLLIAAINYGNGLAYALTFLLAALALVSMLYTHRNLHRLQLAPGAPLAVFAGEAARFPLVLSNTTSFTRLGVRLEHSRRDIVATIDVAPHSTQSAEFSVPSTARGRLAMPAFRLATQFPFGIFYSWSRRVQLDATCLVYPKPAPPTPLPATSAARATGSGHAHGGGDDFIGQREYVRGDSLRHVNWKALARGQGWYTKQFGGTEPARLWLEWDATAGRDVEARLAILCRWVLDAERQGLTYGLRLPAQQIEPGQGAAHQHACLAALALFRA
jgi:uncharacterized protein (DUF58 family)